MKRYLAIPQNDDDGIYCFEVTDEQVTMSYWDHDPSLTYTSGVILVYDRNNMEITKTNRPLNLFDFNIFNRFMARLEFNLFTKYTYVEIADMAPLEAKHD